MLMAVGGLLRAGLVDWITAMTYQSASGAGAKHMRELLEQMGALHRSASPLLQIPASGILDIDRAVSAATRRARDFPREQFGVPLAASLIPWIDKDLGNGQSREEWKAGAEANKIMGIGGASGAGGGICVRVSAMRCHSQALTIKLKRDVPLAEIERLIAGANPWVRVVPERPRLFDPRALAGRGQRWIEHTHRPSAQARHGRGIPLRVHGGRPAAMGGGGAPAQDYAVPASACVSR